MNTHVWYVIFFLKLPMNAQMKFIIVKISKNITFFNWNLK